MAQRIKNVNYRQFLDSGIIEPIGENEIKQALDNIEGNKKEESQALLICMYYTGGRPVEILDLRSQDIEVKKHWVIVHFPGRQAGKKSTMPRQIHLNKRLPFVKILANYAQRLPPPMRLFHNFKGAYHRKRSIETTYKIRYYINKWFEGVVKESIPPYFLRHNRFSKMAMSGASDRDIQYMKGAKDIKSVQPYAHLSLKRAKKVSRFIN